MSKGTVAIIGHRHAPEELKNLVRMLTTILCAFGYSISTGANGDIDEAAMEGAEPDKLFLYIPWDGFNRTQLAGYPKAHVVAYDARRHEDWTQSVEKHHPNPERLSKTAFKLHARNYGVIERKKLVLAFPQYPGSGGTGQGIRLAKALGVPVIECPMKRTNLNIKAEWLVEEIFRKLGEDEIANRWLQLSEEGKNKVKERYQCT